MTRVDFYVVSDSRPDAVERTACRVAEKAWLSGHEVFIHTVSATAARDLDALLWTFRQDSFVPHGLDEGAEPGAFPVRIGAGREPRDAGDVLINFSDTVPLFFTQFSRVAEVVGGTETARRLGRERFRRYRDEGCSIESHEL